MITKFLFIAATVFFSESCSLSHDTTDSSVPQRVQILDSNNWNTLNTFQGVFVSSPALYKKRVIVPISLTSEEQLELLLAADAVDFWHLPDTIPVEKNIHWEPDDGGDIIRIRTSDKDKTITWHGMWSDTTLGRRVMKVREVEQRILKSRSMPKAVYAIE